ncbi:MAG: bile acid:sodium symporter [Patescibacteria group bacterium]
MRKYFWAAVLLAVVLGFIWPTPGFFIKPFLVYILMIIMTLSGLKINLADLKQAPKMWRQYLLVLCLIFILPSLFIFLFKSALDKEIYVGLILAAAAPAAVSVVAITQILGGESIKALVVTTMTHLLSPLMIPFLVLIFARQSVAVDFWAMLIYIAKIVLIPLFVAQVIRYFKWHEFLGKLSANTNTILLMILIWGIIAPARDLVWHNKGQVILAAGIVLLLLIVEIVLSVWLGRTKREDVTWVVVDIYKNFTISSLIALQMFGPLAVLGSVVFSVLDNLIIVPVQWWAKRGRN